ncbi:endonuclease III domain-containing protein [Acidipila sp. EB88]|uniref:endonuclease III domain-containing protein n=1 Tax=Acidipila sp. EB88 TaxID=2305226 RepID=UPI000F5FB12C|nr:base excision DNA repair protein [Acidipila sp. EB88]RRA47126.1 base excision DNA repair protein [Acidipila sp. EB88]
MDTAKTNQARVIPNGQHAGALRTLYEAMVEAYGAQHWWPSESAIETVVGAYLTQNTSWRNVERSIANLKAAGAMSVDGLRALEDETLRTLIRPSGYMVRKAAAIQAFIALLDSAYEGSLRRMAAAPTTPTREALLALPGVGPETADAILLYALSQPVMVVDEYLRRVVTRHGLIDEKARYADIQKLALAAFASDAPPTLLTHYNEFHALIVMVGKTHCGGVPRCGGCPLNQPQFAPPVVAEQAPRIAIDAVRQAAKDKR